MSNSLINQEKNVSLSLEDQKKLEYSGYRFLGSKGHSAVKICHWTKKSILNEGFCYKEKFYGIESHRCLQMSPAVPFCHQKCSFCWRDLSLTKTKWVGDYDDPKTIIQDAIHAQNKLLCGFFGNDKADRKKLEESKKPNNAAISLAGEPMFYPDINDLIAEFKKQDFTTFLVSNGVIYEKLANLQNEPTQLYLSLDAPDKKTYVDLCTPQINDAWLNINKSLETLNSFDSRTCIRTTCVKHKNMFDHENYAKLIDLANPDYIEIKAYMCVGYSRDRLTLDNMPTFNEVIDFAQKIADLTGREITNDSEISRVVLLE
ncbi:putative wyosine biosynthesis protein TYW1 [Methanobrevibacter arboriphilus JCM 13429 = DSM 1125]|uniref:S-adenosyl-L-methionine-dependent tRNA 4-demethylwyosine synthase n=1 Tax=Methanobrevibacter arboriphilus JCM 13429 = DSM 1125 TaxID=1300164 RepID=A0A1V6N0I0_METAZ|nr:4-demethylwyosine synthase TYW1 [Methanobrevibacter arboriphilus]OQD58144.1 putative wyosine biosynthesis protein TYW1 [Methanobrevibacter arboriphilus JCM 13429 = DSM 1125]